MTIPRAITLTLAPDPAARYGLALSATFDERFINALKAAIPSHERRYEAPTSCWYVMAKHQAAVVDLARRYYERAVLLEHEGRRRTDLHTGVVHEQLSLFG